MQINTFTSKEANDTIYSG